MKLSEMVESITEFDLQALVNDEVTEGKSIEFKQLLPGNSYEEKREFLADVSSFANAAGGHLVFGIREDAGIAVDLCGLGEIDADAEILRLENIIRDSIEPRIPSTSMKAVPLSDDRVAIVIYIRRSWVRPHVVSFRKHWKFYSRNSAGKYPLDVLELRTAFALFETAVERIRLFRADRLGKIVSGETPVGLKEHAKIVLHVVPIGAFDPAMSFELTSLIEKPDLLRPIDSTGWSHRHNFDGFLTYSRSSREPAAWTYLQVFRNGIIEAVEASMLGNKLNQNGPFYIPSSTFERELIEALPRFLSIQEQLGVSLPVFTMLSLLGVRGHIMAVDRRRFWKETNPIDRNDLIVPEVVIEDFNCSPPQVLRPIFDAVWNATGWPQSINYNENGEWAAR